MRFPALIQMICVRRCYNNGHTIAEIAVAAKRSRATIRRWLVITGVIFPAATAARRKEATR